MKTKAKAQPKPEAVNAALRSEIAEREQTQQQLQTASLYVRSLLEASHVWRAVRDGLYDVVIGPRSALFAPLARLGLIVSSECVTRAPIKSGLFAFMRQ